MSDGYDHGGTDSTVQIQLVGDDGSVTQWKTLDHWFYDDFEHGTVNKFTVDLLNVGMPCIVNMS